MTRSTSRCADCWTCFALLAPPDPASSDRDRARGVSLRGSLVVFMFKTTSYILLLTHNFPIMWCKTTGGHQVAYSPLEYEVSCSIPGVFSFHFILVVFSSLSSFRHRVWFHERVPDPYRKLSYLGTLLSDVRVCICLYMSCIRVAAAALCVGILLLLQLQCWCLLLMFVMVCRMTCGLFHQVPVFYLASSKHYFCLCTFAVLTHVERRYACYAVIPNN